MEEVGFTRWQSWCCGFAFCGAVMSSIFIYSLCFKQRTQPNRGNRGPSHFNLYSTYIGPGQRFIILTRNYCVLSYSLQLWAIPWSMNDRTWLCRSAAWNNREHVCGFLSAVSFTNTDISSNQISLRSNSWPVIACEHLVVEACKNRARSELWISVEVMFRVSHLIPEIKDTALKDQPTSARFTWTESQWQ